MSKKIIISLICAISLFFVGCGNSGKDLKSESAEPTQKPEQIKPDIESRLKAKNYPVEFVEEEAVFGSLKRDPKKPGLEFYDREPDPLMLVVKVAENGKMSLNNLDKGTINDPTLLSQQIKTIFEDREKSGVAEKEIVIQPKSKIKDDDLEKLVDALAAVKASPIRIIKSGA